MYDYNFVDVFIIINYMICIEKDLWLYAHRIAVNDKKL